MARIVAFTLILLSLSFAAHAQSQNESSANYATWLQGIEQEAVTDGVSPQVAHDALANAMLDERVVALDQKQPEKTVTFDHYVKHIVSEDRVEQGRDLLEENETVLKKISQHFGVPPQIIVALWGIESSFGQDSGRYNIVDSLVTLAYEGRRADFFREELIEALHILDQEHLPATALRGSWAGAMGQSQFMPSTYLRYAIDGDNDGRRDIWNDNLDVWASIANYLAAEGWSADQTWGREVMLQDDLKDSEIGLDHHRSLGEWTALGIVNIDGSNLPNKPLQASLIQPDGPDGRSFLVYDNFRALMRWNRSTYFATTVGLLADRMR
jgi:membrane-bound lytic murein transglycosylase B